MSDLVEFTAAARKTFGARVRWTYLTVDSVPGYQLGESPQQEGARANHKLEIYDSSQWGWGRPPELGPVPPPTEPRQERRNPKAAVAPTESHFHPLRIP